MNHSRTATASDRPDAVSHAVIDAVAAAQNVDPLSLPPLYDAVDPEALDALIDGSAAADTAVDCVRFELASCEVVVRGDGTVDASVVGDAGTTAALGGQVCEPALE
jgi:hypothetical protein